MSQAPARDQAPGSPGTPAVSDINAETYPFEVVQSLIDQSAYLHLLSVPGDSAPIRSSGDVVGWRVTEHLHRVETRVDPPSRAHPLRAVQRVGERLATFTHRWLLVPHPFQARPGVEPPPTRFDPSRPQRFVLLGGVCRFGSGADRFHGFGTGRTIPGGRGESVRLGTVGTWMRGEGRWAGLPHTTYTHCGSIEPSGAFHGSLSLRAMDPSGIFRRRSGLGPMQPQPKAQEDLTYVVLHGRKPGPAAKTRYLFDPAGKVVGLEVFQELTAFGIDAALGFEGLVCRSAVGRVVGTLRSEIDFDLFDPGAPGSAEQPIPFAAVNHFVLYAEDGTELGGFVGDGSEGRTFLIDFPGAPGQRGLRFGGFGRLRDGYGRFAGIEGLMTDNSVVGLAPHVTSTLYVLRIEDPEGRYRPALQEATAEPSAAGTTHGSGRGAPGWRAEFASIRAKKEAFLDTYAHWRDRFRRCAQGVAAPVAAAYAAVRSVGEFEGLAIDAETLAASFRTGAVPFDPVTFERYRGRAKATFRTYDLESHAEVGSAVLHSVWDPESGRDGEWTHKEITGSHSGYVAPWDLPPLDSNRVDLLVNSHHPRVGVTSWVSMYQQGRRERASIAYRLPRDHEVLWIVEEVTPDGRSLEDGVFMASHEWKERRNGRTVYPMVGLFFQVDWDRCQARVDGDRFWKALYVEEDPAIAGREAS